MYLHLRLYEPTLQAQFNGLNLCYLCMFVIGMQQMPRTFEPRRFTKHSLCQPECSWRKGRISKSRKIHLPMMKCNNLSASSRHQNCQNDIIRYADKSQLNCDSDGVHSMVCIPWCASHGLGAQAALPHGYRQTSVRGSIRTSPGAYGSILPVSMYLYEIFCVRCWSKKCKLSPCHTRVRCI
jgi:hypothetical protein